MGGLHPKIRMPLWLAVALPLAAYLFRSAMRGFDFRPDMPIDLVVLAMYAFVLAIAIVSRRAAAEEANEHPTDEQEQERHET